MVGVDAAELSFIRAGLSRLPTFHRLLDEARLLPLRSTADHIPASVWPTISPEVASITTPRLPSSVFCTAKTVAP